MGYRLTLTQKRFPPYLPPDRELSDRMAAAKTAAEARHIAREQARRLAQPCAAHRRRRIVDQTATTARLGYDDGFVVLISLRIVRGDNPNVVEVLCVED